MGTENLEITITEFLSAFVKDATEEIHLRAFKAKGDNDKNIFPKQYATTITDLKTNQKLQAELKTDNLHRGMYFVVNSGGNEDKDITRYNAFFVENDENSIVEQHQALDSAPIQPSIRLETKKSVHAYWLVKGDCSETDWRDVQVRLIEYFDGDEKIKNPSRCMRLPYFDHVSLDGNEYEFKRVEIVTFESEQRFTVEEMKSAFPLREVNVKTPFRDECDECDDSKPAFNNWKELNAELGRRIMQSGKLNNRGKYEARCPVHKGVSATSLLYNPNRNTIKCLAGCTHTELLKAYDLPIEPKSQEKQPQATSLVALSEEAELFVSQNGDAFATISVKEHFETWAVKSKNFEAWLAKMFLEEYGQAPSSKSLEEAIDRLAGEARFGGCGKKQVFTRIAEFDGAIYLDLVNDNWEIVKITSDGWEVLSDYPVKFRRTSGMKSLPIPERDGSLNDLDRFLNIQGDNLILVKAWLLACLKTKMPYPILVLQGEQGSAKSSACEVLCELIDPNIINLTRAPNTDRDVAISATNRLIVCLDNLSGVKTWLSDLLCQISTGGGYSTRKLYSDCDEMFFILNNPILLNGIDEIATRGDLLDRSIVIYLPTIETRKPKELFWNEFNLAKPKIIGALLDVFCEALRNIDSVQLEDYPRMADFTKLGTAAERILNLDSGEFAKIYKANRDEANKLAIEISLIAPIIINLVKDKSEWTGIAKDIKEALDRVSDHLIQRNPYYPKSELKVANDLRRIAPNLRQMGIDVKFASDEDGKREPGTGSRLITIRKIGSGSSQASQNESGEGYLF